MIVLLSPDSVPSERCLWEVEEARRRGTPLFPVICRSLQMDDVSGSFLQPRVYVYADTKEGSVAPFGAAHVFGTSLPGRWFAS